MISKKRKALKSVLLDILSINMPYCNYRRFLTPTLHLNRSEDMGKSVTKPLRAVPDWIIRAQNGHAHAHVGSRPPTWEKESSSSVRGELNRKDEKLSFYRFMLAFCVLGVLMPEHAPALPDRYSVTWWVLMAWACLVLAYSAWVEGRRIYSEIWLRWAWHAATGQKYHRNQEKVDRLLREAASRSVAEGDPDIFLFLRDVAILLGESIWSYSEFYEEALTAHQLSTRSSQPELTAPT